MKHTRRSFLRSAGSSAVIFVAISAGILRPHSARASSQNVRLMQILRTLQTASPIQSDAVYLNAPSIAVDGTSVFIEVASSLPNVDALMVFIDRNPQPLAAAFYLAPEVIPELQMRVKLMQTSQVLVVVQSAGKFYKTVKGIKVTVGGCGSGLN